MFLENKENKGLQILDGVYSYAMNGLPGQKTVQQLGDEYTCRYTDIDLAADRFITNQITKCTTSGFLTNIGGLMTLPVAIPANISSVLYIQMRMIATLAYMGGLDPHSDEVQTLCYVALTGKGASDILKQAGVKLGTKTTNNMVAKISGATLTRINQKVGTRFITKFGEKGIINLGKGVPVVGGFIGGTFDYVTTKIIARTAKSMFIIECEKGTDDRI